MTGPAAGAPEFRSPGSIWDTAPMPVAQPVLSDAERTRIRRWVALFVVSLVVLTIVGVLTGYPGLFLIAIFPVSGFYGHNKQFKARWERRVIDWKIRRALLGDRIDPNLWTEAELQAHRDFYARSTQQSEDQAADRRERELADHRSAGVIRTWVAEGLVASAAPRADLLPRAEATIPDEVELAATDFDLLALSTGAHQAYAVEPVQSARGSENAGLEALERRGLIGQADRRERSVAQRELAPEWLPLVGVALFARTALQVAPPDDAPGAGWTAFAVAGDRAVRVAFAPGSAPLVDHDVIPPDSRYRLSQSTPAAALREVETLLRRIAAGQGPARCQLTSRAGGVDGPRRVWDVQAGSSPGALQVGTGGALVDKSVELLLVELRGALAG